LSLSNETQNFSKEWLSSLKVLKCVDFLGVQYISFSLWEKLWSNWGRENTELKLPGILNLPLS
jgi:uncharacterized membrane protein